MTTQQHARQAQQALDERSIHDRRNDCIDTMLTKIKKRYGLRTARYAEIITWVETTQGEGGCDWYPNEYPIK